MVVSPPLGVPDFHLPAKPGPPDTRASVDVWCTALPSGLVTSDTHSNELPLSVTWDREMGLSPIRKLSSQDVGPFSFPVIETPLGIVYSLPVRSKSASNP